LAPVLWKPFRFLHLSGLRLGFRRWGEPVFWSRRALRSVRAAPGIDALLASGGLIENDDEYDFALLETFVRGAGLPAFGVPGARDRPNDAVPRDLFVQRMRAMGFDRWACPWEASPARGIRLVGLDTGGAQAQARVEEQIPFLTRVLDEHPGDAVLVILNRPPRAPGKALGPGESPVDSEMLRWVLEAARGVKMVLSGVEGLPFVMEKAGLLYVNTPPAAVFPHLIREITIRGNGAVIRNRRLADAGERAEAKQAVRSTDRARRYNAAFPGAYADALEGEEGRVVHPLR
jgi:hypothetical protein